MRPYYLLLQPSINSISYCYKEQTPCVWWWVERYFKDCLCDVKDELSFVFGFISLLAWGIAEVPQIITNFRTKSSHGVSLLFLLTWVVGDVFNLVGCLLEPATLPTQYYTALLYTTSTIVLVLQGLYYDHLYRRFKSRGRHRIHLEDKEDEKKKPLTPNPTASSIPIPDTSHRAHLRREFYYTSARSLAGSDTPPYRSSYLRTARSGPSALVLHDQQHSSSDDDGDMAPTKKASTKPVPIPRSAGLATMIGAAASLPIRGKGMRGEKVRISFSGRRLLQLQETGVEHSAFGQWLGWLMAAIYMGGRFPQIILNIKRRSVEGLNPLMFVFALVANVAYLLSIVVRSTEWSKIKANLPWLLDAIVCVALDLFIILQYVYYKYLRDKNSSNDSGDGDYYVDADKESIVT